MNILIVQTGFLGDVILSTPIVANLCEAYPQARITFLTTPLAAPLVEHHPEIAETLVFDKRGAQSGLRGVFAMAAELRKRNFSIVFCQHKSYRTAALLRLAGIPTRYGFSEASLAFLYSKTSVRSDLTHEVLRNLAILRNIDREPETLSQELLVEYPPSAQTSAEELVLSMEARPLVGIAPGSVWATKRWTVEGFASLADMLQNAGYGVVLVGGPSDAEVAAEIEQRAGKGLLNLVGKTDLLTSTALIDRCELLVSNDSAPLHLASAKKTPSVAVFCATVPEFGYGPWQTPSEVVGVKGLSCRPCGRHGGNTCPTGTHACQRELSAEEVFSACQRVLHSASELSTG